MFYRLTTHVSLINSSHGILKGVDTNCKVKKTHLKIIILMICKVEKKKRFKTYIDFIDKNFENSFSYHEHFLEN